MKIINKTRGGVTSGHAECRKAVTFDNSVGLSGRQHNVFRLERLPRAFFFFISKS
jgi:hypothetical protein